MTKEEVFDKFIRKCKIKNLSDETIESYRDKIEPFLKVCADNIEDISEDDIEKFIEDLKENHNVNDVSICSYLRSVRTFLYYCMELGYVKRFKVSLPKANKKLKETYSTEDLEKLLEKPDINICSFTDYKVWVFENYLLGTGNRLSTAMNIRIKDIDFDNSLITLVKSKNRKQQIIPLSQTLADILREYLDIRGGKPDDYVFCNNYGDKASKSTYQTLVYRYNTKRNVSKTSCHAFRHTFAKQWILSGGDVFRLQKILGHSDLNVTKEYINMFGQDLQIDFERFNPLDRLHLKQDIIRL